MNAADVLDAAANLMDLRGKAVGGLVDEKGGVCAVNAICLEVANGPQVSIAYRALFRFCSPQTVSQWSDTNDEATVIAGLRSVAISLRAKETQVVDISTT
jgi:hypothetical protein